MLISFLQRAEVPPLSDATGRRRNKGPFPVNPKCPRTRGNLTMAEHVTIEEIKIFEPTEI
jgi:hypothetical protein